jgi:hypothetical protein
MPPRRVSTGRVATRAMTTTDAGELENDKHQNQDERDDPGHLHPPWCAGDFVRGGVAG